MEREEFLKKIEEILQIQEPISFDTKLEDLEEWDSLSAIGIIAFVNKEFGVKITINDIVNIKTPEDIAKIAGI